MGMLLLGMTKIVLSHFGGFYHLEKSWNFGDIKIFGDIKTGFWFLYPRKTGFWFLYHRKALRISKSVAHSKRRIAAHIDGSIKFEE